MITPKQLKLRYEAGENISELLRQEYAVARNTEQIIEIAYDIRGGSALAGRFSLSSAA